MKENPSIKSFEKYFDKIPRKLFIPRKLVGRRIYVYESYNQRAGIFNDCIFIAEIRNFRAKRILFLCVFLPIYDDTRGSRQYRTLHTTEELRSIFTAVVLGKFIIACGALAASICVGIVIPSTWFVYLYNILLA